MPVVTRSMKKKMLEAAISEAEPPSPITELPPEMLEMILKNLDSGRTSLLPYRLVHPSWKTIIDDLLEKKSLKTEVDACQTVLMIDNESTFWCPPAILRHTGNPFPSKSLRIDGYRRKVQHSLNISLVAFTASFGNFLTTFELYLANLKTKTLFEALNHLPNLKTLKILHTILLDLNNEDIVESIRLPPLLNLTSLFLLSYHVGPESGEQNQGKFYTKLIEAYAGHLESLELRLHTEPLEKLFPKHPINFRNLRQLKVFQPNASFLQLSCFPALQRISIVGPPPYDSRISIDTLIQFADKFNDSLETLELDIQRRYLLFNDQLQRFYSPGKELASKEANAAGGKRSIPAVFFPKLTKFTVSYPSNDLESAVIRHTFLIKFPVLKELKLLNYREAYIDEHMDFDYQVHQAYEQNIIALLAKEDYWKLCSKLNRISVWFTGEFPVSSNYLLHSTRREDESK